MLVYAWTLYPTVAGGDSGELVAQGCSLGIAHPPGCVVVAVLTGLLNALPYGLSPSCA